MLVTFGNVLTVSILYQASDDQKKPRAATNSKEGHFTHRKESVKQKNKCKY